LGDVPNVLVVTSCQDCYSDRPSISHWANYSGIRSSGLVNIAAPGGTDAKRIPAPITEKNYGLAFGTSQSTALVGGLAAAMMACYPGTYSAPSLKTRLLTTSLPPLSRDVAEKISVGIVDASKALLNPNFHWLTLKSRAVEQSMEEVYWCKEEL